MRGSWSNLQLWQLKKLKKLVLIGKNKMTKRKTFLIVIKMLEDFRKSPFHCFSFPEFSYTFFILFQPKIVHIKKWPT